MTLDPTCHRDQLGQTLDRQPMPLGRPTPIGPGPGHRHLATDTTSAHKHRVTTPALDEQHLQPLPTQRVEGMRDENKTQIITGRRGTMPPLSRRSVIESCRPR
jgi:hypothetical protein